MIDSGFQDVLGQAKRLLNESPFPSLRTLSVELRGDQFALLGNVHSFFLKQVAQETIRSATRGIDFVNEISVLAKS
ncbi:MAG: BON domain-containing protein [Planctomycetes bacterium]|nr:BON domain-containing protein [Planctomycetota bacterium]